MDTNQKHITYNGGIKKYKMEEITKFEANVVEVPKNKTSTATIKRLERSTWKELILDPEKLKMFQDPDQKVLVLTWETKEGYKGSDKFALYDQVTEKQKVGRLLKRYTVETGANVDVSFDDKGIGRLVI